MYIEAARNRSMNIKKIMTGFIVSSLLGSGVAGVANYDKGFKA
jgi:hypothetical protein